MTAHLKVRSYQYINRSYDRVRATLHEKGSSFFQTATRAARARADELASTLHFAVQGFEMGVDVNIELREVFDERSVALNSPVTRVRLGWKAARAASLFPQLEGTLSAWPLSANETQIELDGTYTPPLGMVGQALDALVFHRMAEAVVHRFLEDIVEQLRSALRRDLRML